MMNDDGDTGDEDVWTSKKKPILSSFLAWVQLYNGHLDGPPSSNAPLTYTGDLQRENTRDISGHQDLLANPVPVKSGEVDLLLGALRGRRSRTPCEEALSYPSSLASHHSTHFSHSFLPSSGKATPPSITGFCTLGFFSCFDLLSSRKVVMSLHISDDMCGRARERCAEAPLLTRL